MILMMLLHAGAIQDGLKFNQGVDDGDVSSTKSFFIDSFVLPDKVPSIVMNLLFKCLSSLLTEWHLWSVLLASCSSQPDDEAAQLYLITSCTVAEHVHRYGHHRLCSYTDPEKLLLCTTAALNDHPF